MFDEQPRRVDAAEEAREPERLEAVLGPGVRQGGIVVEQLAQALGPTDGSRLEHVELGLTGEELVDAGLVSLIDRLKNL